MQTVTNEPRKTPDTDKAQSEPMKRLCLSTSPWLRGLFKIITPENATINPKISYFDNFSFKIRYPYIPQTIGLSWLKQFAIATGMYLTLLLHP